MGLHHGAAIQDDCVTEVVNAVISACPLASGAGTEAEVDWKKCVLPEIGVFEVGCDEQSENPDVRDHLKCVIDYCFKTAVKQVHCFFRFVCWHVLPVLLVGG
jgi:hypothetical protein